MAFEEYEISEQSGRPAELYDLRIGATSFKYTSSVNSVTVAVGTFTPRPISRTDISQELSDREADLDITLPYDDPFFDSYEGLEIIGGRPSLTLYRTHLDDPDAATAVFYRGTITNVSRKADGRESLLHVVSVTKSQSKQVPRKTYQSLCNHMLYDSGCTLDENDTAFRKDLNCSAVSVGGTVITLDGAGGFGADFFEAGFLEFDGDFRSVVSQGGAGNNELTVRVPFSSSPLDQTVIARAGCKLRLLEDCQTKFNNVANYGGHPFVPRLNIFRVGIDPHVPKT